jgi:hypothetical protein
MRTALWSLLVVLVLACAMITCQHGYVLARYPTALGGGPATACGPKSPYGRVPNCGFDNPP